MQSRIVRFYPTITFLCPVNMYLETRNIMKVREVQDSIRAMYAADASKYEKTVRRNSISGEYMK